MVSDLFLDADDLRYLTGIGRGKDGKTREELQCAQLVVMRIPFRVNARGAPIVTHAAIQGTPSTVIGAAPAKWQSNVHKQAKTG